MAVAVVRVGCGSVRDGLVMKVGSSTAADLSMVTV